jgi:tetratricopeptide (TPR) repeat protein
MALWPVLLLTLALPAAASLYEDGMDARKRGDIPKAKDLFERLLKEQPDSGGALEGLSLTALEEGDYAKALEYLDRWQKQGDSAYIQSLKTRAYSKLGMRGELADTLVKRAQMDPHDLRSAQRADSYLREDARGLFPFGALYKSLSQEGLETNRPQRIVYEGRSGGVNARAAIKSGVNALAGVSARQEAQRNDTGGFTYYDILEQTYTMGLELRGKTRHVAAQYGQSVLSDNKAGAPGVGRVNFSRAKTWGSFQAGPFEFRGALERSPYYLRGAGGSQFFALLREISGRAEAEGYVGGVGWLARAAFSDMSDRTTTKTWSLLATKDVGPILLQPSYARGFQEFYGAGPTGQLTIMPFDRWAVRARAGEEERWQASASYGHAIYRDGNRLNDAGAEARAWVPGVARLGSVWGSYRFEIADYRGPVEGYRSTDSRAHWVGAFWRRRWTLGPWTKIGYEHGYFNDTRGAYEGNAWSAELEWYAGRAWSVVTQGRLGNTSVRDESYTASLQARWSF